MGEAKRRRTLPCRFVSRHLLLNAERKYANKFLATFQTTEIGAINLASGASSEFYLQCQLHDKSALIESGTKKSIKKETFVETLG